MWIKSIMPNVLKLPGSLVVVQLFSFFLMAFMAIINILEESISLHRLTCHSKRVKQLDCSQLNLNKLYLIPGTSHMPCTGICYSGRRKKERKCSIFSNNCWKVTFLPVHIYALEYSFKQPSACNASRSQGCLTKVHSHQQDNH